MYTPGELAIVKKNARQARITVSAFTRFVTAGVEPDSKLPTEREEALLKGVAALQQISKSFEQIKGAVSDDVLIMMRTELIAVRQLIAKGLER